MATRIQLKDADGRELITVEVKDKAERDSWLAMIAETKRFGESPVISETDLTAIYAAEAARKALESAKLDALRLMAKKNTLTASEVIAAVPMVLKMLFSEGQPSDLASEIIQQELES